MGVSKKKKTLRVAVVGGDQRQFYTARALCADGWEATLHGFSLYEPARDVCLPLARAGEADALVFGLPVTKNGIALHAPFASPAIPVRELNALCAGKTVFVGLADARVRALFPDAAGVYDYYAAGLLPEMNARLTAEALLGLLITELPVGLFGLPVGVGGYGRIGAALTRLLALAGAKVTVFARDAAARRRALLDGAAAALPFAAGAGEELRALVNTVPAPVFDGDNLHALRQDCLLLEAASAPGGFDDAALRRLGLTLRRAPALPGRFSPESAGEAIAAAVSEQLREVMICGT